MYKSYKKKYIIKFNKDNNESTISNNDIIEMSQISYSNNKTLYIELICANLQLIN